jgi:antitoxin (DNA-binding transcriptional repressor) of toxin-antitoxin stability system
VTRTVLVRGADAAKIHLRDLVRVKVLEGGHVIGITLRGKPACAIVPLDLSFEDYRLAVDHLTLQPAPDKNEAAG